MNSSAAANRIKDDAHIITPMLLLSSMYLNNEGTANSIESINQINVLKR